MEQRVSFITLAVSDVGRSRAFFVDPDGFRWEIAMNPGPTGDYVLP